MEAASVKQQAEFAIPSWVSFSDSAQNCQEASELEETLRRTHEPDWRHNEAVELESAAVVPVAPDLARQAEFEEVDRNWQLAILACPSLRELEKIAGLDSVVASDRPEKIDHATVHQSFVELAEYLLGQKEEIVTVHPRSRISYQISSESMPGKRLAIAFSEPQIERIDDDEVISKWAFVYNADRQAFSYQRLFRSVSGRPIKDEPDTGIQREEHPAEILDLVSNIRILAESTPFPVGESE